MSRIEISFGGGVVMGTPAIKTTIPLNLIYDYPVKWSVFKTLRDFVQNFYDAIGWEKWSSCFEYTIENNELTLRSNNVGFSYDWLLHIGASTKRSGDFAGYFGEGFKIASLCALRDHRWKISMESRNWKLRVCTSPVSIDNVSLCSLAYEIEKSSTESSATVLKLSPFSDTELIRSVLLSFYYPENPLFEQCLWKSPIGAVYTRSRMSKPKHFPETYDDSGPGIVYAGFQAMGSFREPLVFSLHSHRNDDRDRGSYYRMQVVRLIERLVSHLPPDASALILERFRSRWYERPRKKYDFDCYNKIIRTLIQNISRSAEGTVSWRNSYPDLLVARAIRRSELANVNRRSQAIAWLRQSTKRYRLVQEAFSMLGYRELEDACEQDGGFSIVRPPNEIELHQIAKLENITRRILPDLPFELPPCKMIINESAAWRGMAVCVPATSPFINYRGTSIRFFLPYVAVRSSLLTSSKPNVALGTYLHELAHVFGGDQSARFSRGLSEFLDAVLANTAAIANWEREWLSFSEDSPTRS
jgi:hypothetical protein